MSIPKPSQINVPIGDHRPAIDDALTKEQSKVKVKKKLNITQTNPEGRSASLSATRPCTFRTPPPLPITMSMSTSAASHVGVHPRRLISLTVTVCVPPLRRD